MATTVFPQTDDVVTRTAWQSLNSTISHGEFRDVVESATTSVDVERLLFERTITSSIIDTLGSYDVLMSISLQAGHTYYVQGFFSLKKRNANSPEEKITASITLDSGIKAYAANIRSNTTVSPSADVIYITDFTGPTNQDILGNIFVPSNVEFDQEPIFWVDMIVVSDQSGDLSFSAKQTQEGVTTSYELDELTFLKATPIKG
jgi:hypothetical protein